MNNTIQEKEIRGANGIAMLFLNIILYIATVGGIVLVAAEVGDTTEANLIMIACCVVLLVNCFISAGFHLLKPNEAVVLTFFGKYYGTLRKAGYYFVNPLAVRTATTNAAGTPSSSPAGQTFTVGSGGIGVGIGTGTGTAEANKKISLKSRTHKNERQKINDLLGNPIEIGVNVIWKVEDTAKAVFGVENYVEYMSIQADSVLRNVVRMYPYDLSDGGEEKSLRGSSREVAENLQTELQEKTHIAGIVIEDVRITHLAYAPEIAAVMLQRQQASAIIEARQKIVEGAVGMVKMALKSLDEEKVVKLDEERKAQMVSNLLVVLCGNKDPQPIVNSGSIY